jgi:hypothetical protein
MRDWLNSLDFKTRLAYKGKLARGFVILLKINALVLLLSIAHCSKPLQGREQGSQSVDIYGANKINHNTPKPWLRMKVDLTKGGALRAR